MNPEGIRNDKSACVCLLHTISMIEKAISMKQEDSKIMNMHAVGHCTSSVWIGILLVWNNKVSEVKKCTCSCSLDTIGMTL